MGRFRKLLPYVVHQWRWLVAILVLTIATSAAGALQPWPMKLLVDYALGDAGAPAVIADLLGAFGLAATPQAMVILAALASIALFALTSALGVGLSLSWNMGGQRMVYDVAGDLFARLQRLSLSFHNRRSVGDSLSRLTEDAWCVYTVADGLLMSPIQQTITLAMMIWIGFALDPVLASLALAVAPALALSSRFFGKRLKQRSKVGREAKSRLMSFVHQTLGAIPLVQTCAAESRNTETFQEFAEEAVVRVQRGNLLGSMYGLVNGLITTVGVAVVLYVGGVRVLSGVITLGTLLVFLSYVRQMQNASGGLFKVFAQLKGAEASVERMLEVMESDEEVTDPANPLPLAAPASGQYGHVRLENVTFGYEPGVPVLHDLTLEARPGQIIALAGPSGAGKSTLASLIPRFFDPWEGRVLLDGVDVRRLKLSDLRSQISVVLQEAFLLPLSVADNIAYGRPGASREEVIAAAQTAQADDFIGRLPEGYDTVLGERGSTLSGGERQRIAIARAVLKDAPVLILDEPTSALDSRTEASVVEALRRLMADRTTFIIAHRLSTIEHADQIAVLDHGRLVELGTHAELLASGALYRSFYEHQFGDPRSKIVA
jgi:ATP-binding cassette subfamily B protein/subfamily B ATP-binding cassette protein MsbA